MIGCSICLENFIKGMICQECARAYCSKHGGLSTCELCGGKLTHASIEYEKIDDILIEWLILDEGKRVGLVDFEVIKSIHLRLAGLKDFVSSNQDILLFPSKKSSNRMAVALSKRSGLSEHAMDFNNVTNSTGL